MGKLPEDTEKRRNLQSAPVIVFQDFTLLQQGAIHRIGMILVWKGDNNWLWQLLKDPTTV